MTFTSSDRDADIGDHRCRDRRSMQSLRCTPTPPKGNRSISFLLYVRRPVAVCFLFLFVATPIVSLQASVTSSLFTPLLSDSLRCIHKGCLQPKRRFISTRRGVIVWPNTIPDATSKLAGGSSWSVATTATNEGESDASVMTVEHPPTEGFNALSTLNCLEVEMQRERMMHALAAVHFKALYDWFLFLPSILLSLLGGVAAFVSNSDKAADVTAIMSPVPFDRSTLGFLTANGVGIVSLVSVFWQSLSKQLNLGGRAMLHESAAIAIKRLLEDLQFKTLDPDFTEEETDAYLKKLNDRFHQAVNGCTSAIPIRVSSAFHSLESDLDLHQKLHDKNVLREFGLKREELYIAAFSELFVTFSNFGGWPFTLPRSSYAVETTMNNLFDKFRDARKENTEE